MKKLIFLLPFLFALFATCSSDEEVKTEILNAAPDVLEFKAEGETKTFTITSNTHWIVTVNSNDTWCTVNPKRGLNDTTIEVKVIANPGVEQPRNTRITLKSSKQIRFVSIKQEGKIITGNHVPLMTINTLNGEGIVEKEKYIKGSIKIESRNEIGEIVETIFETEMTKDGIKGRGNSTWGMEKKPYRLKLDKSVEVLGMPKNKHWVLLANYSDKTLLRNELAFEISRRMGYIYTPRQKYVDVVLNGAFIGNYMLCEHVRIDENRINIAELDGKSTNITGGYFLEIDERRSDTAESVYFDTKGSDMKGADRLIICIKKPEIGDITKEHENYIINHFQKLEDALYGRSGNPVTTLPKYLDLKTFVDNFIINEISKNVDGNLRLSTFMYKKEDDDLLYFGPVWDYDLAFGNVNYDSANLTEGWHSKKDRWYKEFFKHPEFVQMIKDRWKELRPNQLQNESLFAYIDKIAEEINLSQQNNFKRWLILDKYVWPNNVVTGSYKGEISYLKDFITKRAAWMDKELQ